MFAIQEGSLLVPLVRRVDKLTMYVSIVSLVGDSALSKKKINNNEHGYEKIHFLARLTTKVVKSIFCLLL